uniref:Potassium/proton antiporter CemA n=1 Tax=Pseudopediastrum sp. CL0201VA TaxID=2184484 RepID=A0A2U8GJJ9_9CHLO|nr:chloroplast envelope membrane protein [Pseudopediastrum sp. CL0201VA]AWI68867.1 chloroplast envelope membrane protein [Pseudopediastrum sp. CL0201VA]
MDKKTNNKLNLFNWLFKDINFSFLTSNKINNQSRSIGIQDTNVPSQTFIQKKNKNTKIYSKMNSQYDDDQSFNKNELNLSNQQFLKSKEEKYNKKLLNKKNILNKDYSFGSLGITGSEGIARGEVDSEGSFFVNRRLTKGGEDAMPSLSPEAKARANNSESENTMNKRFGNKENSFNTLLESKIPTQEQKNKKKIQNTKLYSNSEVFNENLNSESSFNKKKFAYKEKLNTSSSKSRFIETSKQQVVSITYEEIGLFPRSFNRVFDRFFKQLFFDVENLVIQEYRFYRYLFLTTVKCVFILLFVPLTINFIAKNYFVRPITEYYWNSHQMEIFLNSYQQKKAFTELKNFEEKIYFESLIFPINSSICFSSCLPENNNSESLVNINEQEKIKQNAKFSQIFTQSIQKRLQVQTVELAKHYNEESIEAITNFFADLISLSTLFVLLKLLEIQINITKSFLLEVFFGLNDSKKSLLILFITDLLVGYHSPNIWELFFSTIFDHYGLPESQTTIFLLVATLPVLLDVLFKYLIFRHLNRASPATVATYHAMIE